MTSSWKSSELFDIKLLLSCLSFIKDSELSSDQLHTLIQSVEPVEYPSQSDIMTMNCKTLPALYILMKGRVSVQREGEDPTVIMAGQSFGEQLLTLGEGTKRHETVDAPFTVTALVQPRDGIDAVLCGRLTLDSFRKVFDVDEVKKVTGDVITARTKRGKKGDLNNASSSSIGDVTDEEDAAIKPKARAKKKKSDISISKVKKTDKSDQGLPTKTRKSSKTENDLSSPKRKNSGKSDGGESSPIRSSKSPTKEKARKRSSKLEGPIAAPVLEECESAPSETPAMEEKARKRSSKIDKSNVAISVDDPMPSGASSSRESDSINNSKRLSGMTKAPSEITGSADVNSTSNVAKATTTRRSSRNSLDPTEAAMIRKIQTDAHDNSMALDDLMEDSDTDEIEIELDEVETRKPLVGATRASTSANRQESLKLSGQSPRQSSLAADAVHCKVAGEHSLSAVDAIEAPRNGLASAEEQSQSMSWDNDNEPELSLQDLMNSHQLEKERFPTSPVRARQEGANLSKTKMAYLGAISGNSTSSPVKVRPDGGRSSSFSLSTAKPYTTVAAAKVNNKDSQMNMSKSKLAYLDAISQKSPMPSPKSSPIKELLDVSKTKLMYLDAATRRPALGSSSSLELDIDLEASISQFESSNDDDMVTPIVENNVKQPLRRPKQGSLKVLPTYMATADGQGSDTFPKSQSLRRPRAASWKGSTGTPNPYLASKPALGRDRAEDELMENEADDSLSSAVNSVGRLRQGSWTLAQSGPVTSKPQNVRKLRQDSLKAFQGKDASPTLESQEKLAPSYHQNSLQRSEIADSKGRSTVNEKIGDIVDNSNVANHRCELNETVDAEQMFETEAESDSLSATASAKKPLNVRKLRQDSLKAFQGKKSSSSSEILRRSKQKSLTSEDESGLEGEKSTDQRGTNSLLARKPPSHPHDLAQIPAEDLQQQHVAEGIFSTEPSRTIMNKEQNGNDGTVVTVGNDPRSSISSTVSDDETLPVSSLKRKKKKGVKVSFQPGFATFVDEPQKYDSDEGSVDSALHDDQMEEYKIETVASTSPSEATANLQPKQSAPPKLPSEKGAKKKDKKDKKTKDSKSSKRKGRQSSTEFGLKPRELAKEAALADPGSVPRRPPANVFQKSISVSDDYKAPVFEKSDKSRKTISKALSSVYAFQHLEKKDKKKLVSAFEPKHYGSGTEFLKPGEVDEFFYVVDDGTVAVHIDGKEAREYHGGDSFGASNLVHSMPNRSKSMRAKSSVNLFRVDQATYRSILQLETLKLNSIKRKLLDSVKLFEKVSDKNKQKLADVIKPQVYVKGETIVKQEDYGNVFFIIEDGKVRCEDPELGKGTGRTIERGGYFGETGIVKGDSKPMNIIAKTDVAVYSVDRQLFETILGPTRHVIMSEVDARVLSGITCLQFSVTKRLKTEQINDLLAKIEDHHFAKGQTILDSGVEIPAALYFVRKGEANSLKGRMLSVLGPGSVFGTDLFESAKDEKCTVGHTAYKVVATERTICGVLRIEEWYAVKKKYFKVKADLHGSDSEIKHEEDLKRRNFEFANLVKNVLLGEGQFGQVWMVHDKTESPVQPYALKIQSKFQLLEEGQAEACIREKEALAAMFHPNVIKLYATFQDDDFVYMLLQLLQGGELFNLIHPIDADLSVNGLPEEKARFYSFCIADALAHVHSKCYVYRDMKPENVLIDSFGYPCLIDFGFAKKMVEEKTFTLCGTPGYLCPEQCLSLGHSYAADHWSFGVLVYEMLCGESPFFFYGIDTSELYRSIVQDDFPPLPSATAAAVSLIDGLLAKDPNHRLGSLANGESDIISHPWFQGLDVFEMRKKNLKAPWIPDIKDPFDASHFEDWSDLQDKTSQKFLRLSEAESVIFKNF